MFINAHVVYRSSFDNFGSSKQSKSDELVLAPVPSHPSGKFFYSHGSLSSTIHTNTDTADVLTPYIVGVY